MLDLYYSDIKKYIHFTHVPVKFRHTEFHLHDYYEIYFFISGNAKYFIEKQVYSLNYGDLLITNNNEIHKSVVVPDEIYDVIYMQVDPKLIKLLSSPKFDLLNCFINRPHGKNNKIFLEEKQLNSVIELLQKIEQAYNSTSLGFEILLISYLLELLLIINLSFNENIEATESPTTFDTLTSILEYIDLNLSKDLSLQALEDKFNINRFYLSRLFKKNVGSTLHEYILFKRLALAKKLLENKKSVTEACELSGFNDYYHFIRIFKKYVGTSPGQYKKNALN